MSPRPKPNISRGRRERKGETRAAILAAAERIFADLGLAGARTEAIAARAGVNKALLYYYFKSKEALYGSVLEDHLREFQRRASEALADGDTAQSTLLRYVSAHFDFVAARPYYPRLVQRLVMTGGRLLECLAQAHLMPVYQKLIEVIERGMRTGKLRPVDSHHAVLSLVGLTVFYFSAAPVVKAVIHIDPYEPAHLAQRKEQVLEFIRYGLFRDPENFQR